MPLPLDSDSSDVSFPNAQCGALKKRRYSTEALAHQTFSTKRRRISLASVDLSRELQPTSSQETTVKPTHADRFVSTRPNTSVPLYSTPRTRRIASVFSESDDQMLRFTDTPDTAPISPTQRLLRRSVLGLLDTPPAVPASSAARNLSSSRQFILALDAPGMSRHNYATPLTWSSRNNIAVTCGSAVYYQNLNTRTVAQLRRIERHHGELYSIEWAGQTWYERLGVGTVRGTVEIWDVGCEEVVMNWTDLHGVGVGGMCWNDDLICVGKGNGEITLYDIREEQPRTVTVHKSRVHAVKWSHDKKYMASSDADGVVHIWDCRAGKPLTASDRKAKMKHGGPVKALAWSPWESDLLATGSMFPDGTIHLWKANLSQDRPEPVHTISLATSVTSLHWARHCKELLSTHGISWASSSAGSTPRTAPSGSSVGPLTNSLTVHAWPSGERVAGVTAHSASIRHSCLSPDGTKVFTVCPTEQALKMWHVWNRVERRVDKDLSAFDKYNIR